eukprot:scaffold5198_cov247-Pinguiococcus_pyrenoidosus.AAC.4
MLQAASAGLLQEHADVCVARSTAGLRPLLAPERGREASLAPPELSPTEPALSEASRPGGNTHEAELQSPSHVSSVM